MSLNQEQVATLCGLTARRIRQFEQEGGGPSRKSDGSYDETAVGTWLRARIAEEHGVANDGQAYDYNAERARLTKAQADKTELEVRELRAELVRLPIIEAHWQGMIAGMRGKLLSLPSRIAAKVAGPDRLQEVQEQAQLLVYEALTEIADDAVPNEVRVRAARETEQADTADRKPAAKADNKPVGRGKPGAKRGGQRRAGKV